MSFFRGLFVVMVMLVIAVISAGAYAAVPLTISHQGRLLDASDHPIDGFFDITYRIFEVPTGGLPLWMEVHASVHVTDGLYSAVLGSTVPLSPDVLGSGGGGGGGLSARYLEVTVGATTLSPRFPLSSAPSALSAGHLSGDVETAPGAMTLRCLGCSSGEGIAVASNAGQDEFSLVRLNGLPPGEPVIGTLSMTATPTSGTLAVGDLDGDGLYRVLATVDSVEREISVTDNGPGGMTLMKAKEKANRTKCSNNLRMSGPSQSNEIDESCDASGARSILSGMSGSTTGTIRMMATPDSAVNALDEDSDGDGIPESSLRQKSSSGSASSTIIGGHSGSTTGTIRMMASPDSAVSVMGSDSDGDGLSERQIQARVGDFAASTVVEYKDGDDPITHKRAGQCRASATGARYLLTDDLDGDGVAEQSVEHKTGTGSSSSTIKSGMSGSTTATIRMQSAGGGPVLPSGEIILEADLDGDGVPEVTSADSVDLSGASRRLKSSGIGSSGNDGVEVQLAARPKGGAVKVTASQNSQSLRCTSSADSAAATMLLEADLDGDGVADNTITQSCDAQSAKIIMDRDSGRSKGLLRADSDSAKIVLSHDEGPGGSSAAEMFSDLIDSYIHLTEDGVTNFKASSSTGIQVRDQFNNLTSSVDLDGKGYFAGKIGIGKDPVEKIDVDGGAYCDGTNWVNASDVNSKENFTPVDGNELLEQIAQLSITRWNYKGNNQTEHIGPTAQDFKAAFGVGANDKSISTIDPAGIALAAIKELNSKIQELNAKTDEITQLKAELDAIKAMLQKQAATKN
jgi:hypothetical protein